MGVWLVVGDGVDVVEGLRWFGPSGLWLINNSIREGERERESDTQKKENERGQGGQQCFVGRWVWRAHIALNRDFWLSTCVKHI